MKIFADCSHYPRKDWIHLNPIVKEIRGERHSGNRGTGGTNHALDFELLREISEADIVVVPMMWNYYVEHSCVNLARSAVEQSHRANKPVLFVSKGDYPANLPFSNVMLLEQSAYKSRALESDNCIFAIPAFRRDYLELYCEGEMQLRQKEAKPTVGFCGQASGTFVDFLRRSLMNKLRHAAYKLGARKWEPAPFEPTLFRKKVLTHLLESDEVATDFILRKRYRAGYHAPQKDSHHPTRLEFIDNILSSDYTVCVRGAGNFSVRFYETLSLGRIPVFVDTDCLLPYDDVIDYRRYMVWVDTERSLKFGHKNQNLVSSPT